MKETTTGHELPTHDQILLFLDLLGKEESVTSLSRLIRLSICFDCFDGMKAISGWVPILIKEHNQSVIGRSVLNA